VLPQANGLLLVLLIALLRAIHLLLNSIVHAFVLVMGVTISTYTVI